MRGGVVVTALGPVAVPEQTEVRDGLATVLLRPGQLRIAGSGSDATPARILGSRFRGTDWRVELTVEDVHVAGPPLIAYVAEAPPPAGREVRLGVDGHAHLIESPAEPPAKAAASIIES